MPALSILTNITIKTEEEAAEKAKQDKRETPHMRLVSDSEEIRLMLEKRKRVLG